MKIGKYLKNRGYGVHLLYTFKSSKSLNGIIMRDDKDNLIVKKTFDFALEIIEFTEKLRSLHRYEMSSQLFKSGTSIGANVWEAQNAESKADFIHKFKIAAKESDETEYWIRLCNASPNYPNPKPSMLTDLKSISLIMSKIISSSKGKRE